MNTIQINLLETKQIAAHVNGYATSVEGGYRIVAGEANATQFLLSSVPAQYEEATFSVKMINSQKKVVNEIITLRKGDNFVLPAGMAIAGYGQLIFSCNYNGETVVWVPLKVKIWNTRPDWESNSVSFAQDIINRLETAESNITKLEGELGDIYSVFGTEEGDQDLIVNTLRELLDVFKNYPEGLDIHKELTEAKNSASEALQNANDAKKKADTAIQSGDIIVETKGSYSFTEMFPKSVMEHFDGVTSGQKKTVEIYKEYENEIEFQNDKLPNISFDGRNIEGNYSGEDGSIEYNIIPVYNEAGKYVLHVFATITWNSDISSGTIEVPYNEKETRNVSGGDLSFPLEKGSVITFNGFDNALESEKHLKIEGTRIKAAGSERFVSGNVTLIGGKNIDITQEGETITISGNDVPDTPDVPTNSVTVDGDQTITGQKTFSNVSGLIVEDGLGESSNLTGSDLTLGFGYSKDYVTISKDGILLTQSAGGQSVDTKRFTYPNAEGRLITYEEVVNMIGSGGGGANINGVIETYPVAKGATVDAGDFVEFERSFSERVFEEKNGDYVGACAIDDNRFIVAYYVSENLYAKIIEYKNGEVISGDTYNIATAKINSSRATIFKNDDNTCVLIFGNTNYIPTTYLLSFSDDNSIQNVASSRFTGSNSKYNFREFEVDYIKKGLFVANYRYYEMKSTSFGNTEYYYQYINQITIDGVNITNSQRNFPIGSFTSGQKITCMQTSLNEQTVIFMSAYGNDKIFSIGNVSGTSISLKSSILTVSESGTSVLLERLSDTSFLLLTKTKIFVFDVIENNITQRIIKTCSFSVGESRASKVILLQENKILLLYNSSGLRAEVLTITEDDIIEGSKNELTYSTVSSLDAVAISSTKVFLAFTDGIGKYTTLTIDGETVTMDDPDSVTQVRPATSRLHNVGVAKTAGADGQEVEVYCVDNVSNEEIME